jgi:hypothetical protein
MLMSTAIMPMTTRSSTSVNPREAGLGSRVARQGFGLVVRSSVAGIF